MGQCCLQGIIVPSGRYAHIFVFILLGCSLAFSQTITNLPVSVFTTVKGGVGRQKAECEKMSDGNVGDDDAGGLELLGWRK